MPRVESLEDRTVPSTLTVTSAADKGPGSLRDTITKAKDGDTIMFAPGLNGQTITLTSDQLTINNSLDIEGPGPGLLTISGNDTNRIFNINEGLTVAIDGLTLTHGRALGGNSSTGVGGGGAILNVGGTLSVANDVFISNAAVGGGGGGSQGGPKGGAIANFGTGSLTVTDSAFIDNRADARVKQGVWALGGAIYSGFNGPNITVLRCTFTHNQAIGADGGILGPGDTFLGEAVGGALSVEGPSTSLTVLDSSFTGNQAIGGSGGNAANPGSVEGYFVDSALGGAILVIGHASLIVSGSTFAHNQALGGSNATGVSTTTGTLGSGSGGALELEGPGTITNSTFLGNEAVGGNGNMEGGSNVFLTVGAGYGGAINCEHSAHAPASLTVRNSTFTNNQAVGGAGNVGGILPGDGWGGGISSINLWTTTVIGSTFTGNQATGGAGADGLGGALANLLGSTLTVSGCMLSGNQATGGAGAPSGNGGNGLGGGLYNDGTSTLTVTTSTVTGNQATGGAAGAGGSPGQGIGGGAYFATGGTVCLDASTLAAISGNTASTSNNDVFGVFTLCM